MLDTRRFSKFNAAIETALTFLQRRFEFALWMVTQVDGDRLIVLQTRGQGYDIQAGDIFPWSDSFCARMVTGTGPHYAPDVSQIPAYDNAPISQQLTVGAYIGYPISCPDGSLFGTLCGLRPEAQPASAGPSASQCAEVTAMMLGLVLHSEYTAAQASYVAEQAKAVALQDPLTALYNRRGWNQILTQEERRCSQTHCDTVCVIAIDLDGMKRINDTQGHAKGDETLQRAGQIIQASVRQQDVVARVGGDEFVVLCRNCDRSLGSSLLERISVALQTAAIEASLGVAQGKSGQSLQLVWDRADQRMYSRKKRRKLTQSANHYR